MKRKDWLLVILACIILSGACFGLYQYRAANAPQPQMGDAPALEPATGEPSVTLRITREFGAVSMAEKSVPVQTGDTVMDVLKRSGLDLKTGYNGGFVESLDGLASEYRPGDPTSKKRDWFYYVNGLMADVGAAEYPVNPGDVVWWDFHSWEYATGTPAIIGAYPHPFRSRPGESPAWPLSVIAVEGYEAQAEQLAEALRRVRSDQVNVIEWDESKLATESGWILVGDTSSLHSSPFVQELWKAKQNQGLFADLAADGIVALSDEGQPAGRYDQAGTGLLLATVHPATRLPIWIVSGTDRDGVGKAAAAMAEAVGKRSPIEGYFGGVLTDGKWVRLPVVGQTGGKP
jgi:hypothetical protein